MQIFKESDFYLEPELLKRVIYLQPIARLEQNDLRRHRRIGGLSQNLLRQGHGTQRGV